MTDRDRRAVKAMALHALSQMCAAAKAGDVVLAEQLLLEARALTRIYRGEAASA